MLLPPSFFSYSEGHGNTLHARTAGPACADRHESRNRPRAVSDERCHPLSRRRRPFSCRRGKRNNRSRDAASLSKKKKWTPALKPCSNPNAHALDLPGFPSTRSPGTRENSAALFVTSAAPRLTAVAAIAISRGAMPEPCLSSSTRMRAAAIAAAESNGTCRMCARPASNSRRRAPFSYPVVAAGHRPFTRWRLPASP